MGYARSSLIWWDIPGLSEGFAELGGTYQIGMSHKGLCGIAGQYDFQAAVGHAGECGIYVDYRWCRGKKIMETGQYIVDNPLWTYQALGNIIGHTRGFLAILGEAGPQAQISYDLSDH